MKTILALTLLLPISANAWNTLDNSIGAGGYKHNAYGHGVHADQYGRAFKWSNKGKTNALIRAKPNGYGLNNHVDQYGRTVHAKP